MNPVSDVLKAIAAIPEILKVLREAYAFLMKISGNDPAGMIVRAHEAFERANKAQSPKEKQDAAHEIAKLFRRG